DIGFYSPNSTNVIDYNNYYTQSNYLAKFQTLYTNIYHIRSMPGINNNSVRYNPLYNENMMVQSQYFRGLGVLRTEFDDDVDHQIRTGAWDLGAQQQFGESDLEPMAGTYTVGSPTADYPTLEEALTAIQYHGVVGHVYFNLQPGTYSGGYVIEDFPTEMDYPSQFLFINDNSGQNLILQANSTNAQENVFFQINAARNIFISYLNLSSEPSNRAVHFIRTKGRVDNLQIRHVNFSLPTTNSIAISTGSSLGDLFITEHCSFEGGGTGIQITGSYYDNNRYHNVRVRYNQFTNTQYPMDIAKVNDLEIRNNVMNNFNMALKLNTIGGASKIFKNRMITPSPGSANSLVSMQSINGSADEYIDIHGNIIYLQNHNSYSTSLLISGCSYLNLLHNTIIAENNYFFDYGHALSISNSSNMSIQNNVISAPHRGYALSVVGSTELAWMANAYYGAARYLGRINSTDYAPLELYSQQLADPLASFANPLTDANGYNTSSYLRNRGVISSSQSDIDNVLWAGMPSPGANNIADGGLMFTTDQTIGNGGDFQDLPTALDALQSRGIDADVTFRMLNETQLVNYTLGYIPGTLGGYHFKLAPFGNATPGLSHNATGTQDNYILRLKNLYQTTIEGINFHTQNPSFGTAIALSNFNDNVMLRANSFYTNAINPTSSNVSAIYGERIHSRMLRIEANTIQGMAYGVYLWGSGNPEGFEIKDNVITNAHIGLYLYELGSVLVRNNEIASSNTGLHLQSVNSARIHANKVITSGGNYVLYHNTGTPATGIQEIYNNYLRGSAMQDVIFLSRIQNVKIYHNTIINEHGFTGSRGLNQSGQNPGLDFRNNICVANGGTAARFYSTDDIAALATNIYYSVSGVPVFLDSTPIADLASYSSTFGDFSSMYTDPLLVPDSYLLQNGSPAIDAATPLAAVIYDIDDIQRDVPDIGCAEYIQLGLEAPQNLRIVKDESGLFLMWDVVAGATSYKIYSSSDPYTQGWSEHSVQNILWEINPISASRFYRVSAITE
ncbi:MAG: right-handed parallel beta-helix repeat-containing protein, partial [Candidatus Cloacimonadaceae bacterium]|nr:right-handed parallel beta-helix repeat-containing protein [Candidatus Cloacimonadaceae bacterium]